MYLVSLAEAKKHLNIESYFTEDDSYISMLIEVSFSSIKNKCNNITWIDMTGVTSGTTAFADYTISGSTIPLVIKQATLLMVGSLYANREPVSFGHPVSIPWTLEFLIAPYIDYTGSQSYTTNTTTSYIP